MKSIGETIYWVESHTHYGKSVPCPMCFGKRLVTIILGDESQTKIECGFCSHGLEIATGQAKTWEPVSIILSGAITGISTRDGGKYEVGYKTIPFSEVFDSEAEAIPSRDEKLEEVKSRRDAWFKENFINCSKKQIWSAGYHRDCIKSAERSIEWHKARLGMINERSQAKQRIDE